MRTTPHRRRPGIGQLVVPAPDQRDTGAGIVVRRPDRVTYVVVSWPGDNGTRWEQACSADLLRAMPTSYLSVLTWDSLDAVERYIYGPFVTEVIEVEGARFNGYLISLRADYAQPTADRLASGLIGAKVHATRAEALTQLQDLLR